MLVDRRWWISAAKTSDNQMPDAGCIHLALSNAKFALDAVRQVLDVVH